MVAFLAVGIFVGPEELRARRR